MRPMPRKRRCGTPQRRGKRSEARWARLPKRHYALMQIEKVIAMIPKLRSDGTLPPGVYHASVLDVLAAFPAISPERIALNQALQDALPAFHKLKASAPDVTIYINGSYTTAKRDPNDIDLLFLTAQMSENQIMAFLQHECPLSAIYFDIHADPPGKTYLVQFFSQTRAQRPKGIIVLDL
jgi:hypothetical protein